MTTPITIDIWSDIACPWCYIGKRRLESALETFGRNAANPPVTVTYHSFELSPETPVDFAGSEVDFLVEHKHISPERARAMLDQVTGIAQSVGLDYDFDAMAHTNTVKAHQLLHLAKAHGLQRETKERLLRAYFVEGRHVGRVADLAELGAEVGLDADEITRVLEGDELVSAVRDDQREAQRLGITGVPFHVIDGRYGVSGAQDPATFVQVLEQVVADRAAGEVVELVEAEELDDIDDAAEVAS
ncbi:MAG: DsbA family oxidoreductase [Actinobacteria bacterium]|nr:DsbA family oxidoreductase [Actinomycetota bacterium]